MFRRVRLAVYSTLLLCALLSLASTATAAPDDRVVVLEVDGTIVPVVAQYIDRGIEHAESQNATALVIVLDTPGGLLTATEDIVTSIMNSDDPC